MISINRYVRNRTKKLVAKFLAIMTLLAVISVIPLNRYLIESTSERTLSALDEDICSSVKLGDQYRLTKLTNSLADKAFHSVDIFDRDHHLIASASNFNATGSNSNILTVEVARTILNSEGLDCAFLSAQTKIDSVIIIYYTACVVSALTLSSLWLYWGFRKNLFLIAKPTAELYEIISNMKSDDNGSELHRLKFSETRHIFASYTKLIDEIKVKNLSILELERLSAVAKTVQMLAHDVRKPFALLKAILSGLSGGR